MPLTVPGFKFFGALFDGFFDVELGHFIPDDLVRVLSRLDLSVILKIKFVFFSQVDA
jgi:hypothetical protein